MQVTNQDILNILGLQVKKARRKQGYTQEFVAESIGVSIDLLRNIENGRNIGSIPTIINICNFLKVSPNTLFEEVLDFKEETLDTNLLNLISNLSKKDKKILRDVIIHLDKNY